VVQAVVLLGQELLLQVVQELLVKVIMVEHPLAQVQVEAAVQVL
jgi:hypothetical protein